MTIPETCAFKFVLPPGKKALHWHQLTRETFTKEGQDPAKHYCEATFEVGVPSRYATASTTIGAQPLANWRFSSGYFWMWWTDPINLVVTSAKAWINWNWDGMSCAQAQGGGYEDPYGPGWQLSSHWNGEVTSGDPSCMPQYGWTGATYLYNQVFPPCNPLAPMHLYYDPVQVFGQGDGYMYGYGSTLAQGPGLCYLFLTPHSEIVRTVD